MTITLPVRTIAYGDVTEFDIIRPGERDWFGFDFSALVNTASISSISYGCELSLESVIIDPTPLARIISGPETVDSVVRALVGDMVTGAVYVLSALVILSDQRQLTWAGSLECSFVIVTDELTVGQFRSDYPEFKEDAYPNAVVQRQIDIILKQMPFDPDRFGDQLTLAQELWVAHRLALGKQIARQSARGGVGMAVGAIGSRSVGPVSVTYDLSAGYSAGAGEYNLTTYGQMLWGMIRRMGAGPIQL